MQDKNNSLLKKKNWLQNFGPVLGVYCSSNHRWNSYPSYCKLLIGCLVLVQLLRDKILRFLIKASNLAGLLTSIRQIFPDMEPCQILFQNHGMRKSKIWHTSPLHGNEADAKYHFSLPSGTTMPSVLLFLIQQINQCIWFSKYVTC